MLSSLYMPRQNRHSIVMVPPVFSGSSPGDSDSTFTESDVSQKFKRNAHLGRSKLSPTNTWVIKSSGSIVLSSVHSLPLVKLLPSLGILTTSPVALTDSFIVLVKSSDREKLDELKRLHEDTVETLRGRDELLLITRAYEQAMHYRGYIVDVLDRVLSQTHFPGDCSVCRDGL